MKKAFPHDLDLVTAKKVSAKALDSYRERFRDYQPTCTWTTEHKAQITFSAKGITLKGGLEVRPKEIELELDVPLLLRPFQGKAMGIIEEQIRLWLDRARRGEL